MTHVDSFEKYDLPQPNPQKVTEEVKHFISRIVEENKGDIRKIAEEISNNVKEVRQDLKQNDLIHPDDSRVNQSVGLSHYLEQLSSAT